MKILFKALSYCIFALIVALSVFEAKAQNTPPNTSLEASCRNFTQAFYSWYSVPASKDEERAADSAFKTKSSSFEPELLRLLKDDYAAQAKVAGEIVGLDFDPILATNAEPHKHYIIGKVHPKAGTYWVDVYGEDAGKKTDKPVVTPELRFKDNHWQFVNFHYEETKISENENLLSILKVLRAERAKPEK